MSGFLSVAIVFGSSEYPSGVMATTRMSFGMFRAFFASFSSKAAIQHVPRPSSVAVKIRFCMVMAASTFQYSSRSHLRHASLGFAQHTIIAGVSQNQSA